MATRAAKKDGPAKGRAAKVKDPNAPKRPLGSFFLFSGEKRSKIQSDHPEWKVGQVSQELGHLWKKLDASEKKKYEDKAAKDKERYKQEMEDYKGGDKE